MTTTKILIKMQAAEANRVECYNKAFAARTEAESKTHTLEALKWCKEWMSLLGQVDQSLADTKATK